MGALRPSDGRAAFERWANGSLVPLAGVRPGRSAADLEPLRQMLGGATVVALSEATHCAAEPLELRNRILQYLVQECGFTAIAIESGVVEGRAVHEYVRGGPGDLETVLAGGLSWTFDQIPQNRAMVGWLREYNTRRARPINFYGFDVPGSPGNAEARRGMETALLEALEFLAGVDPAAAVALHGLLAALLPRLRFNLRVADPPGYESLSSAERDVVTGAIADLVRLIEREEASYTAATSAHGYTWGHRAAIGARQADEWLRQLPLDWEPLDEVAGITAEQVAFLSAAHDVRDRAQADNVDWIVQQEGRSGKVLVYASRYHLSRRPVTTTWRSPSQTFRRRQEVAGTHLSRRYGKRLLTIGNCIGRGAIGCGGFRQVLDESAPESIEALMGKLGSRLFLLDLRAAPAEVAKWLAQEHHLGSAGEGIDLALGTAFDVVLYIDAVTPAGAT